MVFFFLLRHLLVWCAEYLLLYVMYGPWFVFFFKPFKLYLNIIILFHPLYNKDIHKYIHNQYIQWAGLGPQTTVVPNSGLPISDLFSSIHMGSIELVRLCIGVEVQNGWLAMFLNLFIILNWISWLRSVPIHKNNKFSLSLNWE